MNALISKLTLNNLLFCIKFSKFSYRLVEELIKLSSVIMTRVKKSSYYKNKYQ